MKMSDDQKYAELKKVLRATLISIKRNGVPLRTLEQIYQEREGRKIPLHGHSDTFALLHSMTDTVCTKWDGNHLLIFPVDTENTRHISEMVAEQKVSKPRGGRRLSSRKQQRDDIWDLNRRRNAPTTRSHSSAKSSRYGSTTKLPQFESKTQPPRCHASRQPPTNNYSYTSTYRKYAESSDTTPRANRDDEISQFNTDISSDYTQTSNANTINNYRKQYIDNGCERSLDSYGKSIESADQHANENGHDQKDGSSTGININCELLLFDEHLIEFDDLPQTKFTEQFHTGQQFRMFFSQIHSPYKFWFHHKEDVDNLELLMTSMDHFYNCDESKIAKSTMPDSYYQLGRICAALYDSQWHRAEIVDVYDISVKIFYVDYGTVAEVPKKDVRFLHKRYSTDPIFAHRGCLDKCKPNNGIWTFEAMNAFTQRLIEHYDKPIMAKVTNINAQEKTLYLELIDTSGVVDLSISQWLIENNFAYPTKKLLFDFTKRHYNEVYPSFERLESGTYPSLSEIKRMFEEGFDFLDYEDSIIIPEMYGYETIE